MKSPARRHRERMTAQAAGTSPAATQRASDQYQTMLAGLWAMRRDLKDIKSIERKVAYKRDVALPQLMDYIDGVIAADAGGQDDVIANAMVWLFDIGDLYNGLRVADYVIAHKLDAPDRYERDALTIVAEEVSESVLARVKELSEVATGEPDDQALEVLTETMRRVRTLIDGADMHDQVAAKVWKASGYVARARGYNKMARVDLARAVKLNEGIGVKKDIERLDREIKKESNAGQGQPGRPPSGTATPGANGC